ncbi:N-acetylmuramidase domain-containing protein [Dokdonella ginsengisoli]|uniref:N-acetylmuramidase domain-containing protein n=1 Tax=Dokdonella ginsengisoli TaxID=363846 RepID=A0ABV9QP61_9GAMM
MSLGVDSRSNAGSLADSMRASLDASQQPAQAAAPVDEVKPGMILAIPAATEGLGIQYQAVAGDTLQSIADRWGVSVSDLRAANQATFGAGFVESGPGALGAIDTSKLAGNQLTVAEIYNHHGKDIESIAGKAGLNVKDVIGIIAQETGGNIDPAARMTIRFEVHKFADRIDATQQADFDAHFKFDAKTTWKGHKFNEIGEGKVAADGTAGTWKSIHPTGGPQDQDINWDAFDYAHSLNPEAAAASISMGPGQVMGFNYASAGYTSAEAMFTALKDNPIKQFEAMTDHIGSDSKLKDALNDGKYDTFATRYNGGGIADYGTHLKNYADAFAAVTTPPAAK